MLNGVSAKPADCNPGLRARTRRPGRRPPPFDRLTQRAATRNRWWRVRFTATDWVSQVAASSSAPRCMLEAPTVANLIRSAVSRGQAERLLNVILSLFGVTYEMLGRSDRRWRGCKVGSSAQPSASAMPSNSRSDTVSHRAQRPVSESVVRRGASASIATSRRPRRPPPPRWSGRPPPEVGPSAAYQRGPRYWVLWTTRDRRRGLAISAPDRVPY